MDGAPPPRESPEPRTHHCLANGLSLVHPCREGVKGVTSMDEGWDLLSSEVS